MLLALEIADVSRAPIAATIVVDEELCTTVAAVEAAQ